MEDNKRIKSFNEHQEKLDISDVINSDEKLLDMKNMVTRILLDFTEQEERYVGGADGPKILVFKGSENKNPKEFLSTISNKIVYALKK